MRGVAPSLVAWSALLALAGRGMGQLTCWDNDLAPNGFSGRATSPPAFPDSRVADDFVVPDNVGQWVIRELHKTNVEDTGWNPGDGLVEVFVYDDAGGCPGQLRETRLTQDVAREFQGFQLFNRDVYGYWVAFDDIVLPPGVYHVGSRWPNGAGSGTTYWLTSNGGQGTERTGCFSMDAGQTWQNPGPGWHDAFELTGDCGQACEPCVGDLDEDCEVDFVDLIRLLSAWELCPLLDSNCDEPGVCGSYVACFEPDPRCVCFSTPGPRGGVIGFCGRAVACAGLEPCDENNRCPAGFVCQLQTCCPQNEGTVCVSVKTRCGEGAGPRPLGKPLTPGTITTSGLVGGSHGQRPHAPSTIIRSSVPTKPSPFRSSGHSSR